MSEFRMPSLGSDMEAGTLVQWLKRPGDAIRRGDIIAVVDTQKGAIEIEVFEDGVLDAIVVEAGAKVPVGTVLATIRTAGGAAPAPAVTVAAAPAVAGVSGPRDHVRASPAARKAAEQLHVDLGTIHGSGPQGAITREDVERAAGAISLPAAAAAAAPAPAPSMPGTRVLDMRAAIAAAMARSKREIPHYYLSTTIDLGAALAWLRDTNEQRPVTERLLPVALLLKAVARSLRDVPQLNGYWIDGAFRQAGQVHIGCAISLRGGGLVAPALHDADTKDLGTIMRELSDLVSRARAGSLRSSELTDPTITVTNLGDQGVEAAFGIIYPPQVALVGFGRLIERPWVVAGSVQPRTVVVATLSADHRASDGHYGGRFLSGLDRLLQAPEAL